jgi:hypothetical protein
MYEGRATKLFLDFLGASNIVDGDSTSGEHWMPKMRFNYGAPPDNLPNGGSPNARF